MDETNEGTAVNNEQVKNEGQENKSLVGGAVNETPKDKQSKDKKIDDKWQDQISVNAYGDHGG